MAFNSGWSLFPQQVTFVHAGNCEYTPRKIQKFLLFYRDLKQAQKDGSEQSDEFEELKKALEVEKLKKKQAVNKLAEVIQRKPVNKGNEGSYQDAKKKEKENRKLLAELKQVDYFLYGVSPFCHTKLSCMVR